MFLPVIGFAYFVGKILGGDQLLVILCGFGTKSLEFGISFLSMTISGAARSKITRRQLSVLMELFGKGVPGQIDLQLALTLPFTNLIFLRRLLESVDV
ncbi:hypothetical protein Tco_0585615 [Tanacetum coccineum]